MNGLKSLGLAGSLLACTESMHCPFLLVDPSEGKYQAQTLLLIITRVALAEAPLTVSVHRAAVTTNIPKIHIYILISDMPGRSPVVVVVVIARVVAVHVGVVHVHHLPVHVVSVVSAVHRHRAHSTQGSPAHESRCHSHPESFARVALGKYKQKKLRRKIRRKNKHL